MRSLKIAVFSAVALAFAAPAFAADTTPAPSSAPATSAKSDPAIPAAQKKVHHKGHHKAKASSSTPAKS